jgi:hypothetical protein
MQANELLARHREHPEGIVVAQVGLDREWEAGEISRRAKAAWLYSCRIEFPAIVRDVRVGLFQGALEPLRLQLGQRGARHGLGRRIQHEGARLSGACLHFHGSISTQGRR